MAMEYGRVSYLLSQEEMDGIYQDIDSIKARIEPFRYSLSPELRRRLKTMGDRAHPFVEKTHEYSHKVPQLATAFFDRDEFDKDWEFTMQLKKVLMYLATLTESLTDTFLAVSADAYAHARNYYDGVKSGKKHNVDGSDSVYEELSKFYRPRKVTLPEEKKEAENVGPENV